MSLPTKGSNHDQSSRPVTEGIAQPGPEATSSERWPWLVEKADSLLDEFTEASKAVAEDEAIKAFVCLCVRLRCRLNQIYASIEAWLDIKG